ncbi:MAG: biotin/lipoyl-containing protein, partial [Panacagrimonas sp.]
MATEREVQVPDIGDFKDVPVIEVLVKLGDTIAIDTPVIVLETDKATMEVPSSAAGVVGALVVKVGDRVNRGDRILAVVSEGTAAAPAPTPARVPAVPVQSETTAASAGLAVAAVRPPSPSTSASTLQGTSAEMAALAPASPGIRKFARELGVDLAELSGTAPRGRIVREDVERYVRQALPKARVPAVEAAPVNGALAGMLPWPKVDFARFGTIERQPLGRLRKISGANLSRNWVMIPHVTNFDEA